MEKVNVSAICIGIDQYESLGGVLIGCENDAAVFAEHLRRIKEPWSLTNLTRLYQNSTYSTLETPTKSHILRAINNINSLNIKPEDYIIFFFAGHGVYQEGHYLLPMDFIEGELKETAISVENLVTRFRDTGSNNIIMILDACRSVHRGRGFPKKNDLATNITQGL